MAAPKQSAAEAALLAASVAAVKVGKDTVVDALTTERQQTVAQPDGSFSTTVSMRPVRWKDSGGAWHGLDLTVAADASGRLVAKSAPGEAPRFAAVATGTDPTATVGSGASSISWTQTGLLGVPADTSAAAAAAAGGSTTAGATDGQVVTYPGVLPGGRTLQLSPTAGGVEESVVVPTRAAATTTPGYQDVFSVPAGVTARAGGPGGGLVQFLDPTGQVIAVFGGGQVSDSSVQADGGPATSPVSVSEPVTFPV